jgi:biotin carboxylase
MQDKLISLKPISPAPLITKLSPSVLLKKQSHGNYVSPYECNCPFPVIILYNPSSHAKNFAIMQLRKAWGESVIIVECIKPGTLPINEPPLGDTPAHKSDFAIEVTKWDDPDLVKAAFSSLVSQSPSLQSKLEGGVKPALHCVWSAQAEDAAVATKAQENNFVWIGANSQVMAGLDKVGYKQLCLKAGVRTADFFVFNTISDISSGQMDVYLDNLVLQISEKPPAVAQKPFFVKSSFGGGGRGTIKVKNPTDMIELRAALRQVIADTGRSDGIYLEEAVDLADNTLFQLELEIDGNQVAPGGRLVWFNPMNQKVLEIGLSDAEMIAFLGQKVYESCRADTAKLAQTCGYDSRGTNEILLARHNSSGAWQFWHSELNCRCQVENEALAGLVVDKFGMHRNTIAEQVMRAAGFAPPTCQDHHPTPGVGVVAHLRLLNAKPKLDEPWEYHGGTVEGFSLPQQGFSTLLRQGRIDMSADPQQGRTVFMATNWQEMCHKLLFFAQNTVVFGPGLEANQYFCFLVQLASNPSFQTMALGCNQTSQVLLDLPGLASPDSALRTALANAASRVISAGYKPGIVSEAQSLPPRCDVDALSSLKTDLLKHPPNFSQPPIATAFSKFVQTGNLQQYYQDLRTQLAHQKGGLACVFPRDSYQERYSSQSCVVSDLHNLLMLLYGQHVGFVGNETGGAKFDVACLEGFNPLKILVDEVSPAIRVQSLTRSQWLNSLLPKSPAEIRFILSTVAQLIRQKLGLSPLALIPYFPNNFHAGNHPEQDVTTDIMLEVGMTPVPNWCWSPNFTDEHLRGWVRRQINLFQKHGRSLNELRIKNAGQSPKWTVPNIWHTMEIMLDECQKAGLPHPPIIHVHNHNLAQYSSESALSETGVQDSSQIAHDLLLHAQSQGFLFTVIDTAPPQTTHNNAEVVVKALANVTKEQKQAMTSYHQMCHILVMATKRFDNEFAMAKITPPITPWAGGTSSSDLTSAFAEGVPVHMIDYLKRLALALFGLEVVVTPYSEILKRFGYAIWQLHADEDSPFTLPSCSSQSSLMPNPFQADYKAFTSFVLDFQGTLPISPDSLQHLQVWKTLLPRPPICAKLLENHGLDPNPTLPPLTDDHAPFDPEPIRLQLQLQYPNVIIDNTHVVIAIAFGASGHRYLAALNEGRALTDFLDQPSFLLRQPEDHRVGNTFTMHGQLITITHIHRNPKTAHVTVSFSWNNGQESFTTTRFHKEWALDLGLIPRLRKASSQDSLEVGVPFEGEITHIHVNPGDIITSGMVLATGTSSKQQKLLVASAKHVGKVVREIHCLSDRKTDGALSSNMPIEERDQLLFTLQEPS